MIRRSQTTGNDERGMGKDKMDDWCVFGWAGTQLEIPRTWELSGLSGDERSGYLRLDDAEMPRLELKWAHTRKKKPDLHATLDEYFKLIRKNYKRGPELSFRRNVTLIKEPEFFEGRNVIGFSWKGGVRANGLIFHAGKRITIVQVMGRLKENWRPMVLRIFRSISTSINAGGNARHTLWSAYGLALCVPNEYKLERQKLLSGYLLFAFVAKSSRLRHLIPAAKGVPLFTERQRLSVERYGPAEVMLGDFKGESNPSATLEAWFRAKYAKAIRGYGFEVTARTDTEASDEYLTLIGQQSRLYDSVPFSPVLALDKVSKRATLAFHLWQCYQSNRIYVIQFVGGADAEGTVQRVAESIQFFCRSQASTQQVG